MKQLDESLLKKLKEADVTLHIKHATSAELVLEDFELRRLIILLSDELGVDVSWTF